MRRRTWRTTAVRFTFHHDYVADESIVWVVENYSAERMRAVIVDNPALFPPDIRYSFCPIMTWHTKRRFLKWALSRPPRSLVGWAGGMRLA